MKKSEILQRISMLENHQLARQDLHEMENRLLEVLYFLADYLEINRSDLDFRGSRKGKL